MKKFSVLTFIIPLFLLSNAFANGAGLSIDKRSRGTAGVGEAYVDEIKDRRSALERQEVTREKMKENPRNAGMADSFGKIDSKEKDQQKQEEQKKESGDKR